MKKLLALLLLVLILLLTLTLYHNKTPKSKEVVLGEIPAPTSALLLPLDSRPPCTDFTKDLGHLAGINVLLPPKSLMDNNEEPANTTALKTWATENAPKADAFLLSTDILLNGGLLQGRINTPSKDMQKSTLDFLSSLHQNNLEKPFYVFSVIPRLLVSDHVLPDRWYQWHLMVYSELEDKRLQGLPYDKTAYEEYKNKIPENILKKYQDKYLESDAFNANLIQLANKEGFTDVVIGQDDTREYSLSNHSRIAALNDITKENSKTTKYFTTQGADELGALAVTRMFCMKNNYAPKVYVAWGEDKVKDYILHFVPLTLQEIVNDKIQLVNGQLTDNLSEADLVLFIHCGTADSTDTTQIATNLKELINEKPVALVDLSMNFEGSETLLKHLMANGTPLVRLVAYSGWNTASNSIGTALSQGVIFTGRCLKVNEKDLPNLYAENLKFTCARLLDDWAYQKLIRYKIAKFDEFNGINTNEASPYSKLVEAYILRELKLYNFILLQTNLKRYSFYKDKNSSYYLKDLNFDLTLPWDRIFEIKLTVTPTYGKASI